MRRGGRPSARGRRANREAVNPAAQSMEEHAPGSIAELIGLLENGDKLDDEKLAMAAEALQSMAKNTANKNKVREAGGIQLLVTHGLLRSGRGEVASLAAVGALQNLARGSELNKEAIREAKAIPALIALLARGADSDAAQDALETLEELATNLPANGEAIIAAGGVTAVADICNNASPGSRSLTLAISALFQIARASYSACVTVGSAGVEIKLLGLLAAPATSRTTKMLLLELFALLASLHKNRHALVSAGGVQTILCALESTGDANGRSFEACRACDALEGLAQINGALGIVETQRLVLALYSALVAQRSAQPLAGDEGKKEYARTVYEAEVDRMEIISRGQAVLKAGLRYAIPGSPGKANCVVLPKMSASVNLNQPGVMDVFGDAKEAMAAAAAAHVGKEVESRDAAMAMVPAACSDSPQRAAGSDGSTTAAVATVEDNGASGAAGAGTTGGSDGSGSAVPPPGALQTRRPSMQVTDGISPPERGFLNAAMQLFKSGGVSIDKLEALLGELFVVLKGIAERALSAALSLPGDATLVYYTLQLSRALPVRAQVLETAQQFLDSRPVEKAALEAAEGSSARRSAASSRFGRVALISRMGGVAVKKAGASRAAWALPAVADTT